MTIQGSTATGISIAPLSQLGQKIAPLLRCKKAAKISSIVSVGFWRQIWMVSHRTLWHNFLGHKIIGLVPLCSTKHAETWCREVFFHLRSSQSSIREFRSLSYRVPAKKNQNMKHVLCMTSPPKHTGIKGLQKGCKYH